MAVAVLPFPFYMNTIAVDFETFYFKKLGYSVRQMIPEQYCRHELFDPYLVSVSDGKQAWAGSPKEFNWSSLHGQRVLSHNARFDSAVFEEMQRRGWIPAHIKPAEWHCTANLTAYLANRRSLDQAVEYLFKTKISKQAREDANGKHWAEMDQKGMLEYATHDAQWCWLLWDKFSGQWPEMERRLSELTINQGKRGVRIDTGLLDTFIIQLHECRSNIERVLPWIAGCQDPEYDDIPDKPTSTKAVAYECRKANIPHPPVKGEDPEGWELWAATHSPAHPWITQLSAWRSVNKQLRRFELMKERLLPGDILPFSLKYFGGHTGRWSGDGRINVQNELKDTLLINEFGLMETDTKRLAAAYGGYFGSRQWPSWVRYAIDPRWVYIPRSGKKMIVSDLSQIEPRVLAWLTGDTEFLRLVAQGQSPYEAFARSKSGWTGGVLKKEDPKKYALSKASVLGLGYQCGWEKFITMAQMLAGVDLTENDPEFVEEWDDCLGDYKQVSGRGSFSKKVVTDFRESNPLLCDPDSGLWATLDNGFRSSVGDRFVMALPSGRQMRYDEVRRSCKIVQDPKTKKPLKKYEVTANVGGRRFPYYGGKLAENITQAIARDVFGWQLLNMHDRGWRNLFGVHDEAVEEVAQDVTEKDVEQEMSRCPDWLPGCPIAAEAHEVAHYLK